MKDLIAGMRNSEVKKQISAMMPYSQGMEMSEMQIAELEQKYKHLLAAATLKQVANSTVKKQS